MTDVLFYVKCINNGKCKGLIPTTKELEVGKIYPVLDDTGNMYKIPNMVCPGYFEERFEKVAYGCIFNVGDKVTIRKDLVIGKRYLNDVMFGNGMDEFLGKSFIIRENLPLYGYQLTGVNYYTFSPDMFEEYVHPDLVKEKENKMYEDDAESATFNHEKRYGLLKTITSQTLCIPESTYISLGETTLEIKKDNFISIIKLLVNKNQKIEAIKLWRHAFKTSLVESKDAIEYLCANM